VRLTLCLALNANDDALQSITHVPGSCIAISLSLKSRSLSSSLTCTCIGISRGSGDNSGGGGGINLSHEDGVCSSVRNWMRRSSTYDEQVVAHNLIAPAIDLCPETTFLDRGRLQHCACLDRRITAGKLEGVAHMLLVGDIAMAAVRPEVLY
jgi:hypothetical protein